MNRTTTEKGKPKQPTHGISCNPELWRRLQEYAGSLEDRSTNWCAVKAIEEYLDRRENGGTR